MHGQILLLLMFQFTHPGRGATSVMRSLSIFTIGFQFTHPGRGATELYEENEE